MSATSNANTNSAIPNVLMHSLVFPPALGGTATLFSNLYRRFPPGRLRILTSNRDDAKAFDASFPHPVVRTDLGVRNWLKPLEWVDVARRAYQSIRKMHRQQPVEALHVGTTIPEGIAGWWAKKRLGVRLVVWVHGEDIGGFRDCRIEGTLQKWALEVADTIVCNSQNSLKICQTLGIDHNKCYVVYPGVDVTRFHPAAGNPDEIRQRYGLREKKVIVTIGRLQRRKGQDNLIRALPRILQAVPNVQYLVVGAPFGAAVHEADEMKSLAEELGVAKQVIFAGPLPDAELPGCLRAADIFAMPNRQIGGDIEGFGQVFLEAAACGKTSIAGNSGGAPEAVLHEETGLLVDGACPDEIAAAAIRLLTDDPLRARLEQSAQKRSADFAWDRVFGRLTDAVQNRGT